MTINNTTKAITPISMLGTMLSKLRPRLEPTEFSVLLSSSFSSLFYVLSSRSRNPKSNKTLTVEFVDFVLFDESEMFKPCCGHNLPKVHE